MTEAPLVRPALSNIVDIRSITRRGPAVATDRSNSVRTDKERRIKSHIWANRMPLPCAEPCDGDPAAPPRSEDHTVRQTRGGDGGRAAAKVGRLVTRLGALAPRFATEPAARAGMLAVVREVAARIEASTCGGRPDGYARCVLHEDPSGWSLAAIVLRPGQATPAHDHGGWGGAVTVQGIERDRRFAGDADGKLELVAERDYPPGTGYLFDPDDVHQPVGADPDGVTVALHFLAPASRERTQHHHETPAAERAGARTDRPDAADAA